MQALGEADVQGVGEPERGLDDGPVGDAAVARDGVEVQVAVEVVLGPFDLPDDVLVFTVSSRRNVRCFLGVLLQIVDGNISVSQT